MTEKVSQPPKKSILRWMNPAGMLEKELEQVPWYQGLIISGLAFALLFWQTGLDQQSINAMSNGEVIFLTIKGLLLGTFGMMVIGLVAWLFIRPINKDWTLGKSIKLMALAYTAPLFSLLIGLGLNLAIGSRTALAFGLTGVLWSLNPMFRTIKKGTKEKYGLSIGLTTIIGLMVLLAWHTLV